MTTGKLNANDEARIYDHEGRITNVEANLQGIRRDIKEIKTNHLAHIEKDIRWLKSKAWLLIGILSLVVFLSPFLARYFVK